MQAIDIALNAYDTSKPERVERRVIRFRRETTGSSKTAPETKGSKDDIGAGQNFGPEETDFWNAADVDVKDLAVVVGESINQSKETSGESKTETLESALKKPSDNEKVGVSPLPTDNSTFYYREWLDADANFSTQADMREADWSGLISDFSEEFLKDNVGILSGAAEVFEQRRLASAKQGQEVKDEDQRSRASHSYAR
ncbi:unnamed protein product, partial [Clonostachys solani]